MSGERSPARKTRDRKRRQGQERAWAKRAGPVVQLVPPGVQDALGWAQTLRPSCSNCRSRGLVWEDPSAGIVAWSCPSCGAAGQFAGFIRD